ncbi:hypothetical protein Dimus_028920 [Dionaea muscipula]
MHKTGRTRFACVRNELKKANANKEPPTTVDMFTAEMEQLQAQKGENCNISDPFSVVMPKEHTGRVRLVGKGITKSDLKASSSSTSTVIDGITVKVPVDLVKSITTSVKTELMQEILSTVLINLQRVIPNLDSDSILAGLAAGIQSPGDVVSGHGTRNASSSIPTHAPSFNQVLFKV